MLLVKLRFLCLYGKPLLITARIFVPEKINLSFVVHLFAFYYTAVVIKLLNQSNNMTIYVRGQQIVNFAK